MPKRTTGGEGKKYPLNMRTTRELREKLNEAAGRSGRSLVQEVEYRLEQSFAQAELWKRAEAFDRRLNKINEIPALSEAPTPAELAKSLNSFLAVFRDTAPNKLQELVRDGKKESEQS